MKSQIIQAIKTFNIAKLQILLDDDRTYMDVSKSLFLSTLKRRFESAKEDGCTAFDDVFFGVCAECDKGAEAMTFLSNSGYYLDIIMAENNGSITDIRVCKKIFNFIDLNKENYLGFGFFPDEKVQFIPNHQYSVIRRDYALLLEDIELLKGNIRLGELATLAGEYSPLKNILRQIGFFRCMGYRLYGDAYDLIRDIDNILEIKSRAHHAIDALISFQKAANEREKLIWFYENKTDLHNTRFFIPPNHLSNLTFVAYQSSNLKLTIDISGYEYVMDYFIKLDNFHDELMEKYSPLPKHFDQSPDGSVKCSLENYLKLHNKYLDIIEKYLGK